MNFEQFVQWLKDTFQLNELDPFYLTETKSVFMVSRPVVQADSLDAYLSVEKAGPFVTIRVFPDKPQDQKLVGNLANEHKRQLKGSFPGVKMDFTSSDASEKVKLLFEQVLENAKEFFELHKEHFVWTLPVKERKKKEKK